MSAGHGFNFVQNLADELHLGDFENAITAVCVTALLVVAASAARSQLKRSANPLIPESKLTLRNFFELLLSMVVKLGDQVMGKENRRYLPFLASIFVFLLAMNFIGLIPGLSSPSDHPGMNLGLALIVFLSYHVWGIQELGFGKYLKHFCGPVDIHWGFWLAAPFFVALEAFSHCVRPLTLTVRLFGNMTADHAVLSAFTDLTRGAWIPVPVIFYMFGALVCFIQAFVFTVLTMVYIRLAVSHGEGHAEEAHH